MDDCHGVLQKNDCLGGGGLIVVELLRGSYR